MTVSVPADLLFEDPGNGVTTSFSYPVRFLDKTDIVVVLRENGVDTPQVLNTHYTIAGSEWPSGGNIVFGTAPTAQQTVRRWRATTAQQIVDLENTQRNDANAVEKQLDRMVMVDQDHSQRMSVIEEKTGALDAAIVAAEASATASSNSAAASQASANAAATSETNAGQSETDAQTAQQGAESARDAALAAMSSVVPNIFATKAAAEAYAPAVAPEFLRTAGYAAAGDGGGALYKKVAVEPTHAGKFSITLADAVTVVWYEISESIFTPAMFGVVDDATLAVDQSAALQAMFDAIPDGATVDFGALRVAYSSGVTVTKGVRFIGRGYHLHGNNAMLTASGARTELTYISAAASAGARQITVNAGSGISPGDVLILQNTNSMSFYGNSIDSRDYTDGEFIEVEDVSGTTVTFKTLLKTTYAGGVAFKVFKVDLVEFNASGGTITGDASFVLNLVHCTGLNLDIEVNGGLTRALYVNQCYNGYLPPNGRFIHKPAVNTGNNYGISFSNSQDILVDDVFAFGLRHGVSMGGAPGDGAVPCRNIIVRRSRIGNDEPALHAADIHGWAVDCYYVECDVDGSVGLGGLNCGAPGCRVVDKRTDLPGKAILLTETVGGTIDLRNMKVRYAPGALAVNVMGIASSGQFGGGIGVSDYDILIDDLQVECIPSLTAIVSHLHNMPGTVKWTLSADRMILNGDTSGFAGLDTHRLLLISVSNTLSHASAPIRAEMISQKGVTYEGTLPDITFMPRLSGGGAGTRVEAPSVGTGAEGRYIRMVDGTQICHYEYSASQALSTAFLGGFRSGAITWTYPQAFSSAPQMSIMPTNSTAFSGVGSTVSVSTATFFLTAVTSQVAATRTAHLMAIGRWY